VSEEKDLPEGWVWTHVGEIYDIVGGGTPSTNIEKYWEGDIAWVTSADIYGLKDIRPRKQVTKAAIENSATNLVPEGSLIVVTRVGLGKVALAKMPLCFSQDSQALIGDNSSIYPDYSLYYLAQAVQIFKYQSRGTTIAGVTKKQLSELPFALPPLAEQHRIVAAIEQQFSRLDVGVAALKRAKVKLKRYRAAVLKAAVEGKLTETWRAEHPTTEPASLLLERILKERRAKWEADLRAKGKDPAKVKYVEPAVPDTEDLPNLLESWCWASVEQLSTKVVDGTHHTPIYIESGIPFISVKDIRDDQIFFDDCKYIAENEHRKLTQRCYPEHNDVLITKSGTIGRVAVVKTDRPFSLFVSVALIKTNKSYLLQDYFKLALEYYILGIDIQQDVKGGLIKNLHLEDLRIISLRLPPFAEQEQIVAEVDRHLSLINQLEVTVGANLKRAEHLRQSILQEAFAGQLVPQDPTDEPASVLLELIRNERNGQKNGTGVNNKKSRFVKVPEPVMLDAADAEQAELWESVGN
jgi:type I restriction enzyme, S subunit